MEELVHNKEVTKKGRLDWIDICKGFAILMVLVGHTAPLDSFTRNFIFSFHMPLFFLLSGFTSRKITQWDQFGSHIKKNFKKLLVPILCVLGLCFVLDLFWADAFRTHQVLQVLKNCGLKLIWARGWSFDDVPILGMAWFIFAMFWGKIIWELICLIFPKWNWLVSLLAGVAGVWLGWNYHWLPQTLDLALVVVAFFALGNLAKEYKEDGWYQGKPLRVMLFVVAAGIWCFLLMQGYFIEMASRHYPGLVLGFIEAICATYAIGIVSRYVVKIPGVSTVLLLLGQKSLWIYLIHVADYNLSNLWRHDNWKVSVLWRVVMDLVIFVVAIWIWKGIQIGKKKEK